MELSQDQTPQWLKDQLFREILEKTCDCEVHLYDVKVEKTLNKKETSQNNIFRVIVKYTQGTGLGFRFRRFIVKAEITENAMWPIPPSMDLEIDYYSVILPRVHGLLQTIGDTTKLSVQCFESHSSSSPRFLVLDDAKDRSFLEIARQIGISQKHMEIVMNKIAKWHATTAYLGEIDPAIFRQRTEKPDLQDSSPWNSFYAICMKSAAECVEKWSGCETYGLMLKKLSKSIVLKASQALERDPTGFNCLTNSDLWISNLMFKHSPEGKPEDVLFRTLSSGYYGPPGLDLAHLLFTSSDNYGEEHWDHLLRSYHEELVRVLKQLGYKKEIPTFLDIYIEFLKRAQYALMRSVTLIGLRLVNEPTDISGLFGEGPEHDSLRKQMFLHPKYRSFLEPILEFCYKKGIMDA